MLRTLFALFGFTSIVSTAQRPGTTQWKRVYEDETVRIDMDPASALPTSRDVRQVTFRWTWAQRRAVKSTPGVWYKSRIKVTEFNCEQRLLHTLRVALFDEGGREIQFDRYVPSSRWDAFPTGSMAAQIADAACALKLLAANSIVAQSNTAAQHIRVAVALTEDSTGGVLGSNFRKALRGLGDVDIVARDEEPDYVLDGVAICDSPFATSNACGNPSNYVVALSLQEPISHDGMVWALRAKLDSLRYTLAMDTLVTVIATQLANEGYVKTRGVWVAEWGRNQYEQRIREFVARVDATCFELHRIMARSRSDLKRGVVRSDRAIKNQLNATAWIC